MKLIEDDFLPSLIGLTTRELEEKYPLLETRFTEIDGEPQWSEQDMNSNRLNVKIESGRVVEVEGWG